MNGALSVINTLANAGVEVCFTNPGTSELHLVAALNQEKRIRTVLGLHENVVTGAADGYGRMAEKPAATLLHLGPGLANGSANLHNAKKASSPIVNLIGNHPTYHSIHESPLGSDVKTLASFTSHWVHEVVKPGTLSDKVAEAVQESRLYPGNISTLIIPSDLAWSSETQTPRKEIKYNNNKTVSEKKLNETREVLEKGEPCLMLLSGATLKEDTLEHANRIANKYGIKIACETLPGRVQRGAGRPVIEWLHYLVDIALEYIKEIKHVILVGVNPPVSTFAYPGIPYWLTPEECEIHILCNKDEDKNDALHRLSLLTGSNEYEVTRFKRTVYPLPEGELTVENTAKCFANLLPDNAIIVDESNTCALAFLPYMWEVAPHDYLTSAGGSLGFGLPAALGASIASPNRKVICLHGDGGVMYSIQALWTVARENLDVTTLIFDNGGYALLGWELNRMGLMESAGETANKVTSMRSPKVDFASISKGLGVDAKRVSTVDEFRLAFEHAMSHHGPFVIEVGLKL